MVVAEPGEESNGLSTLVGLDRRRVLLQGLHDVVQLSEHARPVLDCSALIIQHRSKVGGELIEQGGVALTVYLDVDERLTDGVFVALGGHAEQSSLPIPPEGDHRMHHRVDPQTVPTQRHAYRVDQERHVVSDGLDNGVRRLPAVAVELRVIGAHAGRVGRPTGRQAPVSDCSTVKVDRVDLGQVVRRRVGVVPADE